MPPPDLVVRKQCAKKVNRHLTGPVCTMLKHHRDNP